jgi:hypothetical protein
MESWRHKYGDKETLRTETWRHGEMETGGYGDMEIRDMKTWRNGDMERWRHGHGDIKRQTENRSPGDFP